MSTATTVEGLVRFDASQGPRIVGANDGKAVDLGSIGARMMAWTE